jgi:hypothetical protein
VLSEHRYRILLAGELNDAAREAFDGWKIEPVNAHPALIGDMDQAALHGVLNRIRCLGLALIEVRRLEAAPANAGPDTTIWR